MLDLFRFYLVVLGVTYLVTESSILSVFRVAIAMALGPPFPQVVRRYVYLGLYCPACVGFWVGLLVCACGLYPWPDAWTIEAGGVAMGLMALTAKLGTSNEADLAELPFWDPEARVEGAPPEAVLPPIPIGEERSSDDEETPGETRS